MFKVLAILVTNKFADVLSLVKIFILKKINSKDFYGFFFKAKSFFFKKNAFLIPSIPIFTRKLSNLFWRDLWRVANSALNKGKSTILPLFN